MSPYPTAINSSRSLLPERHGGHTIRHPVARTVIMGHRTVIGALLFASLVLAGCGKSNTDASAPAVKPAVASTPATAAHLTRLTVIGIDRSGSYAGLLHRGLAIAAALIEQARPGDAIIVRWISGHSYESDQVIAHIVIPLAPNPLQRPGVNTANPFDVRARGAVAAWQARETQRRQAFFAQLRRLKAKEVARLCTLTPHRAPTTDIFGFVAAAADAFTELAHPHQEKELVLVTDLKDTVHRVFPPPDLAGVRVAVWGIRTGSDPLAAERLRKRWRNYFLHKTHAASVAMRTAEFAPAENGDAPSPCTTLGP